MKTLLRLLSVIVFCAFWGQSAFAAKRPYTLTPRTGYIDESSTLDYLTYQVMKAKSACNVIKLKIGLPNYCAFNADATYVPKAGDGGFVYIIFSDIDASRCGQNKMTLTAQISRESAAKILTYNFPQGAGEAFWTDDLPAFCTMQINLLPESQDNSVSIRCGEVEAFASALYAAVGGTQVEAAQVKLLNNAKLLCFK